MFRRGAILLFVLALSPAGQGMPDGLVAIGPIMSPGGLVAIGPIMSPGGLVAIGPEMGRPRWAWLPSPPGSAEERKRAEAS